MLLGADLQCDLGRAWLVVSPSQPVCVWSPPPARAPAWVATLPRLAAGGCQERLRVCGGDGGLWPGPIGRGGMWKGWTQAGAGGRASCRSQTQGGVRRQLWAGTSGTRGSPVQSCPVLLRWGVGWAADLQEPREVGEIQVPVSEPWRRGGAWTPYLLPTGHQHLLV